MNSSKRATLLVLEDKDDMLSVLESTLTKAGYEVLKGHNGREGEKLLEERHIDLVLTDLVMPEEDGVELLLRMRSRFGTIPVIAMSAWGDNAAGNYLSIAKWFGARAILQKPFTREKLLHTIASVLPGPSHHSVAA